MASGLRVALRGIEAEDYELLRDWQNDAEVAYWMDYRTPFSLRDIEEDQERARSEGRPFVITYEGKAIGKAGLNQFRWEARVAAMYIYIGDKSLWGQGLGRDAIMALLALAFDELGLQRVELTLLAENKRAQKAYESCGFVLEGTLRGRSYRAGTWHDTSVMSVSRDDYIRVRTEPGG